MGSVHVRFHRVRIHEMYSCGVENARATVICLACTLRAAPKGREAREKKKQWIMAKNTMDSFRERMRFVARIDRFFREILRPMGKFASDWTRCESSWPEVFRRSGGVGRGRIPAITIVLVQQSTQRQSLIVAIHWILESFQSGSIKVWLASFEYLSRYLEAWIRCEFKKKKYIASLYISV